MTRSQQSSLDQLILHNPPHLIPKFVIHPVLKHVFGGCFIPGGMDYFGDKCWFQRRVLVPKKEVSLRLRERGTHVPGRSDPHTMGSVDPFLGCHPKPIDEPTIIFQRGSLNPPTRLLSTIINHNNKH